MIIPDVNVLLHLHRDEGPEHAIARSWWAHVTTHGQPVTVPDLAWVGFLRLATNPRVYRTPSSLEQAWAFVEAMRANGIYVHYAAHPRLLELFGDELRAARATGNLVTDAYMASCALAFGATLATFDRDFRRFDGLEVMELN